ncbi:pilin assembly protein [Candidatus Vecturithrix granuli]|uniref:Pilin assembly protein n=1 Tax=Vecturithrix granuli TaxID=1499967 RepID=A0A081BYM8_VECG1|nr:pilin assembly protein [Candidatus Vecturithrix granuli]
MSHLRKKHDWVHQQGYTLLELIVVVLIIGVLSGIAIPNFLDWLHEYRLQAAANTLMNHLRAARLLAIFTGKEHQLQIKNRENGNYYQVVQDPKKSSEQVVKSIGQVILHKEFGEVMIKEPISGTISFYPKGTSSNKSILLENSVAHRIYIRVNNFGRIKQERL